jgi:hypothetical protein
MRYTSDSVADIDLTAQPMHPIHCTLSHLKAHRHIGATCALLATSEFPTFQCPLPVAWFVMDRSSAQLLEPFKCLREHTTSHCLACTLV